LYHPPFVVLEKMQLLQVFVLFSFLLFCLFVSDLVWRKSCPLTAKIFTHSLTLTTRTKGAREVPNSISNKKKKMHFSQLGLIFLLCFIEKMLQQISVSFFY
jgi:hypothetical protein